MSRILVVAHQGVVQEVYRGLEACEYETIDLDALAEEGVDGFCLGVAGSAEEAARLLEGAGLANRFSDALEALEAARTLRELTPDRIDLMYLAGAVEWLILPLE